MKRFWVLLLIISLISCKNEPKPTLRIFTWSDMLDSELIHEFEEIYHCRVLIDLYDSNESMYAKLKLGNSSYDLLFPSNYFLEIMEKQGMIQKLNFDLIPNDTFLDPFYFSKDTNLYGIPFMVSYSGIGYRQDKVHLDSPSYTIFNSSLYSGRMTMLNDIREALGASLKTLGYSINSIVKEEIEAAADLLISWKQHLAKFENEQYKNGLISREFLISQSYSNDILQVQIETDAIAFAFPKEGAILAIEFMTIPVEAPNTELAHAFINYMISPAAAAHGIERSRALIPVITSYELLPEHLKNNPVIFPSEEQKKKMEKIHDLGDAIRLYYQAWERVKGS